MKVLLELLKNVSDPLIKRNYFLRVLFHVIKDRQKKNQYICQEIQQETKEQC
jgi:hypothetical protein